MSLFGTLSQCKIDDKWNLSVTNGGTTNYPLVLAERKLLDYLSRAPRR